MPKRTRSACNSVQNLGIHAIHHSSGTSETAEVNIPASNDVEEVEYVGYMPHEEIWEEAEVMELAGDDLEDDEENKAKGGAVWMMLAKGLADWEEKRKAEKAESARPNRPTFYSKNSAKTLERKRKAGELEPKIDLGRMVSVILD